MIGTSSTPASAAPLASVASPASPSNPGPHADADAVALRRGHVQREAAIRSIGTVYFISAGLAILGALMVVIRVALLSGNADEDSPTGLLIFLSGLSAALIVVGRGVRALARWTRIPVVVLSGLGLLAIPVGTLIHGFVLWLVLSGKGRTVFSEEYAAAVAATPDVVLPRSPLPAVFLALILGLMVFALVAPAVLG